MNLMRLMSSERPYQQYPTSTITESFIEVGPPMKALIPDLKPENLLFRTPAENSELLIADFGLSKIIDEESFHVLTTTCGTPGYMAPEIFKKSGHGKPVDIWALGVITYFLLCGYTPFDRDSSIAEMQAIMAGDYSFDPPEYWEDVSEKAKNFIRECLTVDPTLRLTAKQCLEHPWLSLEEPVEKEADLLPTIRSNFNARRYVPLSSSLTVGRFMLLSMLLKRSIL
jgi:calcium/calmodulin-dependent protein kinase I